MKLQILLKLAAFIMNNKGKTIVYIAGKVTGLPYIEVWTKFNEKQRELEALGFAVLNPCEWMPAETDWRQAMKYCIALLAGAADQVYLLPDWNISTGAKLEKELCDRLGITDFAYSPGSQKCDCKKNGTPYNYDCPFAQEVHNDNIVCTKV